VFVEPLLVGPLPVESVLVETVLVGLGRQPTRWRWKEWDQPPPRQEETVRKRETTVLQQMWSGP
jgi:hypothetical protein